jgi:hypothetical protein
VCTVYQWPFRKLLGGVAWLLSLLPVAPSLALARVYVRSMDANHHTPTPIVDTNLNEHGHGSSSSHSPRHGATTSGDLYDHARRLSNAHGNGNGIWRSELNTAISVISLMRSSIAQNALSMAEEEMRDIGPITTSRWRGDLILATHHQRIRAIWSGIDQWAPPAYIDTLLAALPSHVAASWSDAQHGRGLYRDTTCFCC